MRRLVTGVVGNPNADSSRRPSLRFLSAVAGGCLTAILLCAQPLHAQVFASISGRVTDPTGATAAGAAITATNLETGEKRTTVSDDAGRYWIPSLAVGEYEVQISKEGFQAQVRAGIHLVVGQEANVDFALKLGQVSEQVKVDEDAPLVGLTAADISGLVAEEQVKEL